MTKDNAIAELVRIWHSPHLDLSLKAGLAEAIDALKENNLNDALVRDDADDCKESESKLDLSAEPKTGKWTEIENGEYLCSNCLHITIGYPPSNCPNCGSFNGGEEE